MEALFSLSFTINGVLDGVGNRSLNSDTKGTCGGSLVGSALGVQTGSRNMEW